MALAQKVQELNRYRSDFFGRLRQILGARPDVRVVGDRFVFQSSVLFDVGKADISPAGHQSLDTLAAAVVDLEREIPPDIPWILRVDGHTDNSPITGTGPYKSNWELSAARAVAVVQYLIIKGVEADRLAAAGFGEFQPLDVGTDVESRTSIRRIEIKLTERLAFKARRIAPGLASCHSQWTILAWRSAQVPGPSAGTVAVAIVALRGYRHGPIKTED